MTNSAAASAFGQWLQSISPKYQLDLTTVSRAGADAGFRSYHRIAAADGRSFIAMNAEGETPESFASFIKVDGLLRNEAGLNAPEIFEAAIATSSMATDLIKGKTIDEALKLTNKAVVEALEGLPPIKVHCSVLAEQAVKAALSDYYRRQGIDPEPIVGKLEEDCEHCESCGN